MQSFLQQALAHLNLKYEDLSTLTIVLPSKRAGAFLKQELRVNAKNTSFAPSIISIEDFIELVSGLAIIDNTEFLYRAYNAHLSIVENSNTETFETFSTWATTLLSDFNEIDRYLIDPKKFFDYLSDIKDLEHWYLQSTHTTLIKEYLAFWNSLYPLYEKLNNQLANLEIGYQGMVYKSAANNIEHYIASNPTTNHIFIGFNALNNAEQTIIQELLETGNSEVIWDIDSYFYEDTQHSVSLFLRRYLKSWKNYKPNLLSSNYSDPKNIEIIEVSKNIGQAKYIGEILSTLSEKQLNETAVVLGDENLLTPVLNSLPENVKQVNITMGVSLKSFSTTHFFDKLLQLHQNYTGRFYYKDIIALLSHPISDLLLQDSKQIMAAFVENNNTYVNFQSLIETAVNNSKKTIELLFGNWHNNAKNALQNCIQIIISLKKKQTLTEIENVTHFKLHGVFEEILGLESKFGHLKNIKSVSKMFQEVSATTTLDFEGDAFNGLQIMGVLETRVLDFKNVIIASVNEGIFPSGKSNASYITYDLKTQFGLPQFTEKDAIYTYHFYHILQRAENIHLLYNNFSEGMNSGEKSRFIFQLEIDALPNHNITKKVLSPKVTLPKTGLTEITKTDSIMERIQEIAVSGFSPSSLTSYIRNPIEFYYQKVLGIRDANEIEETVAANTIGTIIHDSLENLYKPFLNETISVEKLKEAKKLITAEVDFQFKKTFKAGSTETGKNLLIFEVAKRYISNFIDFEINDISAGNSIKLVQLEKDLETNIEIEELPFPVKIRGKVDRVDFYNGQLRIIDYKTGTVKQTELVVTSWEDITLDYKYSKIIQVLAYALMASKSGSALPINAGIISFKNLANGFLPFTSKVDSKNGEQAITQETLNTYLIKLKSLIIEICSQKIPFIEKAL